MSVATRAVALQSAVTANPKSATAEIVAAAEAFNTFLNGDETGAAATSTPGAEPAKPTEAKPTAAKPAAAKPAAAKPAQTEEKAAAAAVEANAAAADATALKAKVSAAVSQLLANNLRDTAVEILKGFGAEAVKGLKPEQYAPALEKLEAALLAA